MEDWWGLNAHDQFCAAAAGRRRRAAAHVVTVDVITVDVVGGGGGGGGGEVPVVYSTCEISLHVRPEPIRVIVTVVVPSPETV